MQYKRRRVQRTSYCRGRRNDCEDCYNGCIFFFSKFAGFSHLNRKGKQAAEKWHEQMIELKQNMVVKLQKAKRENKGWQRILTIWGHSLTPWLLALEKKEPKLLKTIGSYVGREHKAIQ